MLLIITPNPALDRTFQLPTLVPGTVHRTAHIIDAAGGKGLNVARAAQTLGTPCAVCTPLGGLIGARVRELAAAEGILLAPPLPDAPNTRICTILAPSDGSDATVINEAGTPLPAQVWAAFIAQTLAASARAELALFCGSVPGAPDAAQLDPLLRRESPQQCRLIVDSSGPTLQQALVARVYGIKVNADELAALLDVPIRSLADARAALDMLRQRGIALAVVTLGAQGALATDASGMWYARPPAIQLRSSVGSGDSFLAGLATSLLRGMDLAAALRMGVACGAADAETFGGGLFTHERVTHLAATTHVESCIV
jgi:1-phosphofructokinase family hexose kinase